MVNSMLPKPVFSPTIQPVQIFQKAIKVLKFLIEKDAQHTKLKKVPVLFWYSVGTPKPKNLIKNFQTLTGLCKQD